MCCAAELGYGTSIGNWGATNPHAGWRYADLDGAGNGFDYENVGELTVTP
jgi:hypothetical protein